MTEYEIRAIDPEKDLKTLDERVARLPEWRRRVTLPYLQPVDRLQSALGYELAAGLLRKFFGIRAADFRLEYDAIGKPAVACHPDLFISLAHCKAAVMAAVSDMPVGCDIEEIRRPFEQCGKDVMDYCYSPGEQALIAAASDRAAEFTRLWTVKEALYKLDNTIDIECLDTSVFVKCAVGNHQATPAGMIAHVYENNTDTLLREIEIISTTSRSFVATVAKKADGHRPDAAGLHCR